MRKRKLSTHERIRRLKAHYTRQRRNGQLTLRELRWAVLNCHFRNRLTYPQTADVLGVSEAVVRFHVDIIRQDSR